MILKFLEDERQLRLIGEYTDKLCEALWPVIVEIHDTDDLEDVAKFIISGNSTVSACVTALRALNISDKNIAELLTLTAIELKGGKN